MKRDGDGIVWRLVFEFAPAAIFGSATAFASAKLLSFPRFDVIPVFGVGAFLGSWLLLRRLGAGTGSLPLADFDQSELERELANLAEEVQRADGRDEDELLLEEEFTDLSEDELLLEDPLAEADEESRVIRLFDPSRETAGEMQARIDRHLRTTARPPLSDATQELHEALSALRQSLR